MFQNKILPSLTALLALAVPATAQIWGGNIGGSGGTMSGGILVPPTLPSLQYRFNNYDRTIGNSWLGGTVHAYAGMVRQKQGSYELGQASAEFAGTAKVLQMTKEVAEIVGNASNIMNNGVQTRSGLFRIEVMGYTVINSSFAGNSTFAAASSVYNLLPSPISASVPVGPTSVTLNANAGCGFGRSANWLLPAASASVGLNANANAYAFVNASVSWGIPGFNVGVGIQGRVLEQTLAANLSASAVWGLSGSVTYTLQAISLHLYAWATAIYTWTTNLCSWSAGLVNLTLI